MNLRREKRLGDDGRGGAWEQEGELRGSAACFCVRTVGSRREGYVFDEAVWTRLVLAMGGRSERSECLLARLVVGRRGAPSR